MNWLPLISYFLGGIFFTNAVPHFVSGSMGMPFQSPFAKPPGIGLSSPTVNVMWGLFNIAIGYLLLVRVGNFELRSTTDILSLGMGVLLMATVCAKNFGKLHGGNEPGLS